MYYYTYKVEFTNGDYYLGQHKTTDLNDGYTGSGKKLKERNDPFVYDILEYYNNQEELNKAEKELIGDLWFTDPKCLNMKEGGVGGWDAVNKTVDRSFMLTEEYRNKLSKSIKELYRKGLKTGWTKEAGLKGIERQKELYPKGVFYGRKHTEETKKLIGERNAIHQKGKGNSQYGTMWITNGTINQKIRRDESIPEGFKKGRVLSRPQSSTNSV
jgi:hypothetical protein